MPFKSHYKMVEALGASELNHTSPQMLFNTYREVSEVRLDRQFIEVKSKKAKSAKRRIVTMQPNLVAWLRPYSGNHGKVVPKAARGKVERVRKETLASKWPNNGLRHSFASDRLAATHDAPRTSSELNHTSPQMLFNTYREVVTPDEAARYWQIAPADKANVVSFASQK